MLAMSNRYKLQKMVLVLLVLMLLSVLEVSAFQVIPVVGRRTTTKPAAAVSRTTLWGKATNGEKAEECMMTDLQRARDCASNAGECSVEELEELSNGTCYFSLSLPQPSSAFVAVLYFFSLNQCDFLTHTHTHIHTHSPCLTDSLTHLLTPSISTPRTRIAPRTYPK